MLIEMRGRCRMAAGAVVVLTSGCDSDPLRPEAVPPPPPDVRAYVSGSALDNLDENGHFRLTPADVEGPHAMITAEQAQEIALGVIRTWYANPNVLTFPGSESLVESAERGHGASIDWQAVRPSPRSPYFAESQLEPLPLTLSNPAIRHFGPLYAVPLYVGATPVVVVGVAAYATNIMVDEKGFIRRADNLDGGGEIDVLGIPLSLKRVTVPPSPEHAVEFAALSTGEKVVEVPVLGVPGNRVTRLAARWRVRLEEAVEFERRVDGEIVVTDEIYVGIFRSIADARLGGTSSISPPRLRMYVAAATQPTAEEIRSTAIPIRAGYAVDLHEVTAKR